MRCWSSCEDLPIGDRFWHRFDEPIGLYDKLLVVLSAHSVGSAWIERAVMAALETEQQLNVPVLFPIALDEAIEHSSAPWAADARRRHSSDFTHWKDHDQYQQAFTSLLRDLQASASPDQPP